MKRVGKLVAFTCVFGAHCLCGAAVTLHAPASKSASAKSLLTLSYSLTSDEDEELSLSLELPEGWSTASTLSPITVPAGQTRKKLVTVLVPANATSQHPHDVILMATSRSGDVTEARTSVSINARHAVGLAVRPHASTIWSGDALPVTLHVRNLGNGLDRLVVEVSGSREWYVDPDNVVLDLEARSGSDLTLNVHAPSALEAPSTARLRVKVYSASNPSEIFEVVPIELVALPLYKTSQRESLNEHFPVHLQTISFDVGRDGIPKTRVSLYGQGDVTDEYSVNMDLNYTFLNNNERGSHSRDDFGRVDVLSKSGWLVSAGDTELWMTKLSRDLFGRGVRLTGETDSFRGTLFQAKRHKVGQPHLNEYPFAADAQVKWGEDNRVGTTFIHINENPRAGADFSSGLTRPIDSTLLTAYSRIALPYGFLAYGELGAGRIEQSDLSHHDGAWLMGTAWQCDAVNLSTEVYRSGLYYPGTLSNRYGYLFTGSCELFNRLSAWGEHESFQDNVGGSRDTPIIHTRRTQVGMYQSAFGWLPPITLSGTSTRYRSYEDFPPFTNTSLDLVTLSASPKIGRYNALLRTDLTYEDNKIAPLNRKSQYYLASIDGKVGDFYVTLTGSTRHSKLNPGGKQRFRKAELSLSRRLWAPLTAVGKVIYNDLIQADEADQNGFRYEIGFFGSHCEWSYDARYRHRAGIESEVLDLEQDEPFGRLLARVARRFANRSIFSAILDAEDPTRSDRNIRLQLQWDYDFSVPVPYVYDKGQVGGRLYVHDSDRGIEKIPVSIGAQTTYTDDTGHFRFSPMKPGSYQVVVDQARLPAHLILQESESHQVELTAGQRPSIQIPVTMGGEISGVVFEDAEREGDFQQTSSRLHHVRVMLFRDGELIRQTYTSRSGTYHFGALPPGTYEASVDPDYVPDKAILTTAPTQTIELSPTSPEGRANFGLARPERKVLIKKFGANPDKGSSPDEPEAPLIPSDPPPKRARVACTLPARPLVYGATVMQHLEESDASTASEP